MADLMPERQVKHLGHGYPSADAAIRAIERKQGPRSAQFDYRDGTGLHVGSTVRWDKPDGKTIRPVARIDGQWKHEGMPSPRPLFRLPEMRAADQVVITEGEKAADAAVRLGYEASTSAHGSKSADKTDWSPLAGKEVVILPDNDEAGKEYAAQVATILASLVPPPTVKICELPDLPEGGDIADLVALAGDDGLAELRSHIDALLANTPVANPPAEAPRPDEDGRPKVWLKKGEKSRITDQSLALLAGDHFERGTVLVQCLPSPAGTTITPLSVQTVDDNLNRRIAYAIWKDGDGQQDDGDGQQDGGTEIRQDAPTWLAKQIVGMQARLHIRHLEGTHRGPFLRKDGSIGGIRPGYDEQSQYLIETSDDWSALETPTTQSEVHEAIATLRAVVAEFPFENDTAESVWVALILTRLARAAFDGPSPLFMIESTTRGSGKTMLARLAGLIADGKSPAMDSFSQSEEEMRKLITSKLVACSDYLIFDNVAGAIKSPTLDRLLTANEWEDRLLGTNQTVNVLNTLVPVLTANNAAINADTLRRSLFLRLSPLQERPEERTFRIVNLQNHVMDNRRLLLIASMRLLQWYVQCGRPQQLVRPMGSFESWSDLVRQAVIHAGLPDPCVAVRATDAATSASEAFLIAWTAWDRNWTGSARHMVEAVFGDQCPAAKSLQEAILEMVGSMPLKDGRPDPQAFGNHLGRMQGRNFANLRIMKAEKRSASGFVWRLEKVTQPAKK